ncbi:hypothetical protein [Tunturiibacter gelidoferens]|uniref:DUF3829 domain-containing protein n=1 Tax=Tunturiibacter gelidiferens TaxID=3069689 RepID=A0A9X0U4X3_9BACT|nr:hypothetical protein [Edaphobacter lichenicola]MBB5329425.1 hypothetical protein [Edaphobacter lichenicola]
MYQYKVRRYALLGVLSLIFSSIGCKGPSSFKAPVTTFRDSSSVVIESTKVYLTALNKTERDHYISSKEAEPAQIKLSEIDSVQVFSPEEIGTRIRALDELTNYTDLLYKLATSDAGTTAQTNAKDLGEAITNLSGEVTKLTGEQNDRFKDAATGAFALFGEVLQMVVNSKIEDGLRKAIAAGDGPVNKLIAAIESDTSLAYQRKRSSLSSLRTVAVDAYNTEFAKGRSADRSKLNAYANVISETEDRWEAFQTARPVDGLEAMQKANTAMVTFAKHPKPSVTDFSSFVDSMESFAATAKRVGDAVKQIEGK